MISKRILECALEHLEDSSNKIMESQKSFNDAAIVWSKSRLIKWIADLDDVHSI